MYRRPLLAVFEQVYAVAAEDRDEALQIPRAALNELLAAADLAPLAVPIMRAFCPPALWCMDASPTGGGICSAPISAQASRALWRNSETKSRYSRLEVRPRAVLRAAGALPADMEEDSFPEG